MTIQNHSLAKNTLSSNGSLTRFLAFHFLLLCVLSFWLFKQNQPTTLPSPSLTNGKVQCISYSPYYQAGISPLTIDTFITPEQINQDLAKLSKLTSCVRIYSVSQGLDYVPKAASQLGMKVYLGVWIGWIKSLNEKELNLAIKLANQYPDTIKALIVGNEVLLRGEQSESALKTYILKAKAETDVAVTYADVWEFWRKHPALEDSVDFVTVHILPYWEDHPQSIHHALKHTSSVMDMLAQSFKKPILIGETGWPSVGRTRQESSPSLINQATYIRGFLNLAQEKKWQYNLIEAIDQPWKRDLEGTVGGYWGIYNTDFEAKFALDGDVKVRHDGLSLWLIVGLTSLLFLCIAYLLGEKRALALTGVFVLGALSGLTFIMQMEYLAAACRGIREWLALGGLALLSPLIAINLIWLVSKPVQFNLTILKISTLILTLSALIASALLIMDGRYRDFPISLFLFPALALSISLFLLRPERETKLNVHHMLNILMIGMAIYCIYLESANPFSYIWLAVNGLLALSVWPKTPHLQLNDQSTSQHHVHFH